MQHNSLSRYSDKYSFDKYLSTHKKSSYNNRVLTEQDSLPKVTKSQKHKTLSAYQYELQNSLKKQMHLKSMKNSIQRQVKIKIQKEQHEKKLKIISQVNQLKQKLRTLSYEKQTDLSRKLLRIQNLSYQNTPMYKQSYQHPSELQYRNPYYNYSPNQITPIYRNMEQFKQEYQTNQSHSSRNKSYQNSKNKDRKKRLQKNQLRIALDDQEQQITSKPQLKIYQKTKYPKHSFQKSQYKKRLKDFQRNNQNRKEYIKKRLRKCFLAVYFLKILQKTCLKIINERRNFFLSYWPNQFLKSEQSFQKFFFSKFQTFFKFLYSKKQSSIIIEGSESKSLKRQKINMLNEFLKLFFKSLQCLKNNQKVGQICWAFCKHGSFIDKGVLSSQQIQLVCISQKFGYLRMDKNLQCSQIINLLIFKLIIFKYLLHPWSYWLQAFNPSQNKILVQNIKFIASIIYEIFIEVQQSYLQKVNKHIFKIGNWKIMKTRLKQLNIKCCPSLLYETQQQEGQIISGLFKRQYLSKRLSITKRIQNYKLLCQQIVEDVHQKSNKYQKQFNRKVASKKVKIHLKY